MSGLKLLDDGTLTTSVAEGGAGAADTAGVLYSTTARTTKAIRLIGRIRISEATAGTWATAATEASVVPFDTDIVINARYSTAAAQSIPTGGTGTIIDFGTKSFDSNSGSSSDSVTTGASWKFTAPVNGKYEVSAYAILGGGGGWVDGEAVEILIFKNGTAQSRTYNPSTTTHANAMGGFITDMVSMVAGDYIDIRMYQTSGGSISLVNNASYNWVVIKRVGN